MERGIRADPSRRADICSRLEQHFDDALVTGLSSHVESRETVSTSRIDFGSFVEQAGHRRYVTGPSRLQQIIV